MYKRNSMDKNKNEKHLSSQAQVQTLQSGPGYGLRWEI